MMLNTHGKGLVLGTPVQCQIFALGVLHVADRYGLGGRMQGEVALSASVRQDDKIGVLAWDWVSARCTTHDVG